MEIKIAFTNKLKILTLLMIFNLFFLSISSAQKPKNRIILWDVTQSMRGSTSSDPSTDYGYEASKDIDQKVRAALIKIIDSTKDDEGGFKICPFGTKIWEYKDFPNNVTGRENLKNYIKQYKIDKKPQGFTNICSAWTEAMTTLLDHDQNKQNLIILFTDGSQNIPYGPNGKDCLKTVIESFCELTKKSTDMYTFYVSLNLDDNVIKNANCPNVIYVNGKTTEGIIPLPLALIPKFKPLVFNVQKPTGSIERFDISFGDSKTLTDINATLEIGGQYKLGVKSKIKAIQTGYIDVSFNLDDIDNEVKNLKSIKDLKIEGKIIITPLTTGVSSPSVEIPINIINKQEHQLNFIIK